MNRETVATGKGLLRRVPGSARQTWGRKAWEVLSPPPHLRFNRLSQEEGKAKQPVPRWEGPEVSQENSSLSPMLVLQRRVNSFKIKSQAWSPTQQGS